MIPNLTVATWTRHDLCDRMLSTVDVEVGHLVEKCCHFFGEPIAGVADVLGRSRAGEPDTARIQSGLKWAVKHVAKSSVALPLKASGSREFSLEGTL